MVDAGSDFDLEGYRRAWRPRIDSVLAGILDAAEREDCPRTLCRAMRHAVLAGGKRLRPMLCLSAARSIGKGEEQALYPACALELVHAYSLVHDDLPSMDNDSYRRGQPTCHRLFGEAAAILAGDALLTLAFRVLVEGLAAEKASTAVLILADGAGHLGMVGGQADDVGEIEGPASVEQVELVHQRKTAALFESAVRLGGLVAGAAPEQDRALARFARCLGLAYQIVDDLLDWAGDAGAVDRPGQADRAIRGRSHPLAAGPRASRDRAISLIGQALGALERFDSRADALRALAGFVLRRAEEAGGALLISP